MNVRVSATKDGFEAPLLKAIEALPGRFPYARGCAEVLFRDVGLLFSVREAEAEDVFVLEDGAELFLPCGVVVDTLAQHHEDGWFSAVSLMACADGRLLRLVEWFDVAGVPVRRVVSATTAEQAVEAHGLPALLGGLAAQALRLARAGRGALVMDWVAALESAGSGDTAAAA